MSSGRGREVPGSPARRSVPRRQIVVASVAATLAVAYVAGVMLYLSRLATDDDLRTQISDIVPIPLHIAAVGVLLAVAHGQRGRRDRSAWRVLALASAAYGVGDVVWCVIEVGLGQSPFPSVADAFYLAYYPLLAVGLLRFVAPVTERSQRIRARLDVAIVVLGGFIIVYYVLLGPALEANQPSWLAGALSVAYPVGDVFLLYAVAMLLVRGTSSLDAAPLAILVASQGAFFVADLAFGALSTDDSYVPGSWVDGMWLLAVALVFVAALVHGVRPRDRRVAPAHDETRRRSAWLPYVALGAGYGVVAYVSVSQAVYPIGGVMVCAGGLTALVIARQVNAIRENARLLEALRVLATTDALTGLTNRGRFYELAPELLEDARNDGEPIAVLMIDLDHFKSINDTFGHAAGDQAIQLVAEACRTGSPAGSIIARYGGDEIIALLPRLDARRALDHADRIQQAVSEVRIDADPDHRLTVSIGVAAERDPIDVEALAGQADAALYRAKNGGRARASMAS